MTRLEWLLRMRERLNKEIEAEKGALARLGTLGNDVLASCAPTPTDDGAITSTAALTMRMVERVVGVSVDAIVGPDRAQEAVNARQVAAWALREAGLSYPAIGRALKRDHTTAMHAVRKVAESPDLTALAMSVRVAVLAELAAREAV